MNVVPENGGKENRQKQHFRFMLFNPWFAHCKCPFSLHNVKFVLILFKKKKKKKKKMTRKAKKIYFEISVCNKMVLA